MNYYEELGVSPQATEQEIRKAHRRLVKLMHPDAQPDQNLKMLAETQMRRLNSIVSTLLDPEQRRVYDVELKAEQAVPAHGSGLPSWQGIPWWLASAVGAVVLTLVAVWLWADHLGATFTSKPRVTVIPSTDNRVPAGSSAPDSTGASYALPPAASPSGHSESSTTEVQVPSTAEKSHKDSGGIDARVVSDPPAIVKPAAKPEQTSAPPAPVKPQPKPPAVAVSRSALPVPPVQKTPQSSIQSAGTAQALKSTPQAHGAPTASSHSQPLPQAQPLQKVSDATAKPRKVFSFPPGSLIASASPLSQTGSALPPPPGVASQTGHDPNSNALPGSSLPSAVPPPASVKIPDVNTSASTITRDPLEGEWVYAPKEPERRRSGFYPPEFIDLKLSGAGDPGSLKGQYNAKYVVTDRPVSPEVNFQLASVSRGSHKFVWQSNDGAKGTLSIDPIDERTIRIDWHTTSGTRGPALTSGQATLVRRQ